MKKNAHHRLRAARRRFRIYKWFTTFWALLIVVTFVGYAFVIGPSVFRGEAAETLLCLRICAQGVSPCLPTTCANPAVASTQAVTNIAQTTATGNGTVISDGGDAVTERGFALATTTEPTTSDTVYTDTSAGTGSYSVSLTGLTASKVYYVRAYAVNGIGTSYGSTVNFTTLSNSGGQQTGGTSGSSGGGPGASFPAPPTPKQKKALKDILIAHHPVKDRAYAALDALQNIAGNRRIATGKNVPIISFKNPVFKGNTNIKNAYILISLYSTAVFSTTSPDADGNWTWVAANPLEEGEHTIVILAVSPEDDSVAVSASYTFIVTTETTTQPPPAPPAGPEQPTGGGSGGVPEVTIEPETPSIGFTHDYVINVQVLSKPEEINKQGSIDIKTEIASLKHNVTEPGQLTYALYDNAGSKIFEEQKILTLTDTAVDYSRAVTSQPLDPGNYVVDVQLHYRNRSVGTSKVFEVKSYNVIEVPLIAITEQQLILGIHRSMAVVGLLFFVFLLLLLRERRSVRRATHQVNDTDLFQSGMIA
ncbi:MAG: hypothetical protein HY422_00485 [Candidatus Komeilibacteria bacterium]|nr:hypothetical protein [Candidatus Komeilibacteria bacterium]